MALSEGFGLTRGLSLSELKHTIPNNSDTSGWWTDYHFEFKSSTSSSQLLGLSNEGIVQSRGLPGSCSSEISRLALWTLPHFRDLFNPNFWDLCIITQKCPLTYMPKRENNAVFYTQITWLREQWLKKTHKQSRIRQMSACLSQAEADPIPLKLLSGTGLSDGL